VAGSSPTLFPWCASRFMSSPSCTLIHVIFGWLQVGEVIAAGQVKSPRRLHRHPHAMVSGIVRSELGQRLENNNTLYIPRPKLSFWPEIDGFGTFGPFFSNDGDDPRRLSEPEQKLPSQWRVPSFFSTLSNMGKQPAPQGTEWYPRRRGPGQEFVLHTGGCEREVEKWLERLFETAAATISRNRSHEHPR